MRVILNNHSFRIKKVKMAEVSSARWHSDSRTIKRCGVLALAFGCLLGLQIVGSSARAQGVTGSIKGTVSANAAGASTGAELLPGASLTLVNRDVTSLTYKTVSDETGNFSFLQLPAGIYTLVAAANGLTSTSNEIRLASGASLVVEIVLNPTVSESVTIRDEEGLLSSGETTTSNTIRAEKLEQLPLRSDNFQGALPLTPSVIRDVNGAIHIKGTRAGANAYTVNGADVTDPVNGNLAFDIPLEAAGNVRLEENPYSADFGKTNGGASNLETKSGGDKFKFGAARIFPTFHHIISGKVDSFRPRLTFEGPIIRKRLNFLQSFEYRFSRIYVPSLTEPRDNSTAEAFNSFTQLDLMINKSNRLKVVGALFPEKRRYVGLNTFNPQETTPNTKQRGTLFSVSEQAIFHDQSFLSSLLAYKSFNVDVFGQGGKPLTVLPDGNSGSYFADTRREAQRWQWQEQYFARTLTLAGQHSFKFGGELDYTSMLGSFDFRPIEIRRRDETLSQRIEFVRPTAIDRTLTEFGGFIQDRWVVNKRMTVDGGLRFDRNTISNHNNVSPRVSMLYLPWKGDRTIVRGGIGLFFDRSPLANRYFAESPNDDDDAVDNPDLPADSHRNFPERVVTTYAEDGATILDGPREFINVIKNPLRDARSLRWSVQIDYRANRELTLRAGYLERFTRKEPILVPQIFPQISRNGGGLLVLENSGASRYHEFQALALYNSRRFPNWTISYVWSRAQGNLNTADNFLSDFPALVVRPDQFGTLPFDISHRFLAYGEVKAPLELTIMPALEVRSGFPFSFVNERLDFVGARNSQRFPYFLSLDMTILKSFTVPYFDKKARAGVIIFNVINHFNPRDVQNNLGSLSKGQFFNSLGTSVRGKFELDF